MRVLLIAMALVGVIGATRVPPEALSSAATVSRPSKLIVPSQMLVEPHDGVRRLVRALDRAQRVIFLEDYILTDRSIIRALQRAAAQSVRVYVMLEHNPLGMGQQPAGVARELRAAGVAVKWAPSRFFLTHAKMAVLDDRIGVISTANMSRSAFTRNREFIVFDGVKRDVTTLSNLFRRDWDRMATPIRDPNLVVAPENARGRLETLLRSAHRTVDIYAEEIADARMQRLLIALAHHGRAVRVVIAYGSTPLAVAELQANGVQVRQLRAPYVHAKTIVIDATEAFVGSENLSTASLDRNREVGVLIRGPAVGTLMNTFARDWVAAGHGW